MFYLSWQSVRGWFFLHAEPGDQTLVGMLRFIPILCLTPLSRPLGGRCRLFPSDINPRHTMDPWLYSAPGQDAGSTGCGGGLWTEGTEALLLSVALWFRPERQRPHRPSCPFNRKRLEVPQILLVAPPHHACLPFWPCAAFSSSRLTWSSVSTVVPHSHPPGDDPEWWEGSSPAFLCCLILRGPKNSEKYFYILSPTLCPNIT